MKRSTISFVVCLVIGLLFLNWNFAGAVEYNGLKINPDNRKYFMYQGSPIFLVGAKANESVTNYAYLYTRGINEFGAKVLPLVQSNCFDGGSPYRYCRHSSPANSNVGNNWGGWDDNYWTKLRETADDVQALGNDAMLFILVFSTNQRKMTPNTTWPDHLWNHDNGGPVNNPAGGVSDFYLLYQYGTPLFDFTNDSYIESTGWGQHSTPGNWQWQSQYRQEQLLAKLDRELPPDAYPNVGIILQWEINVGWDSNQAEEWANHMIAYLKSMRTKAGYPENTLRPIGIGSHYHYQLEAVNAYDSLNGQGDGVFGVLEGNNVYEVKEGITPCCCCMTDQYIPKWDDGAKKLVDSLISESPGAIYINGKLGVGTSSPTNTIHIETTGSNSTLKLNRTDGATVQLGAKGTYGLLNVETNHNLRFATNDTERMIIEAGGDVGIGLSDPSYLLHLSGGAYCDGGAWVAGSSREYKKNIHALTTNEALAAFQELKPVKFNYKVNEEEDYLGFISEDVPELVATKERKGVSPMDVVAVLTKVVQEQQKVVQEQQKTIKELKKRVSDLEKK